MAADIAGGNVIVIKGHGHGYGHRGGQLLADSHEDVMLLGSIVVDLGPVLVEKFLIIECLLGLRVFGWMSFDSLSDFPSAKFLA